MKRTFLPVLGFAAAAACAQSAGDRPNVVLIVADDLGYGDLSCYGATAVSTPNVDSIARSGTRFTDAHAVAATSTPSRYSLLTGEYCFRRPGTNVAAGNAGMIIRPEQHTLADVFKKAGYATAAFGKWHLGLGDKTAQQDWNAELDMTPRDLGFDEHFIMAATADRVPCVYIENGRVVNHDPEAPIFVSYQKNFEGEPTGRNNPELLTKQRSSHGHDQSIVNGIGRIGYMKGGGRALWRDEDIADSIAANAIAFIERHAAQPFFIYLCTNDVHVPRQPHERFRGKSPMGLRGEAIMQFDETVGRVAQTLRSLGLAENTVIIITSDNGAVVDDGYRDGAEELLGGHKPSGPWRGNKYSAFEGGTAVPFIVSWAGHVPRGKASGALVSHIDFVATAAALVGVQLTDEERADSRNHLPTWLGQSEASRDCIVEMAYDRSLQLRTPEWKYISPSRSGPTISWGPDIESGLLPTAQLYDMTGAKDEKLDVSKDRPDVVKELSERLAAIKAHK